MCEPITAGMSMASLSTFGTMMSGMLSIMQGVSAASDAQKAQNAQIANIYAQQDANNKLLEMQYAQARLAQDELNRRKRVLVSPVKIKSGEVFTMESGGKYLCTSRGNFVRLDKKLSKKARRKAARK